MDRQHFLFSFIFAVVFALRIASSSINNANGTSANTSTTLPPTNKSKTASSPLSNTSSAKVITTSPAGKGCNSYKNCEDCTDKTECYWCSPSKSCEKWPKNKITPGSCSGNKWYWKQCTIPGSFQLRTITTTYLKAVFYPKRRKTVVNAKTVKKFEKLLDLFWKDQPFKFAFLACYQPL